MTMLRRRPILRAAARQRTARTLTVFFLALCTLLFTGCDTFTDAPADETLTAPSAHAPDAYSPGLAQTFTLPAHITPGCVEGVQDTGALYRVCFPPVWNGGFLLYAPGYVPPNEPDLRIREEVDDLFALAGSLGFALATTSYRKNGLAIVAGLDDVRDLTQRLRRDFPFPGPLYLVGVSEGDLVATLAVEQHPDQYSGAVAVCGPSGDFQRQLDYISDFRVLFDYFFPGVLPGDAVTVPQDLFENWESVYLPRVLAAIAADPQATARLLRTSRAPVDPNDPASVANTVERVLRFNVLGAEEAQAILGGNPYDNTRRFYTGSGNDLRLNLRIQRFRADPEARREVARRYQTTGDLDAPIVSLHNTLDPEVPIVQQFIYRLKTFGTGSALRYTALPIDRYGHCVFTDEEQVVALAVLVLQTTGQRLVSSEAALADASAIARYHTLLDQAATAVEAPPPALEDGPLTY